MQVDFLLLEVSYIYSEDNFLWEPAAELYFLLGSFLPRPSTNSFKVLTSNYLLAKLTTRFSELSWCSYPVISVFFRSCAPCMCIISFYWWYYCCTDWLEIVLWRHDIWESICNWSFLSKESLSVLCFLSPGGIMGLTVSSAVTAELCLFWAKLFLGRPLLPVCCIWLLDSFWLSWMPFSISLWISFGCWLFFWSSLAFYYRANSSSDPSSSALSLKPHDSICFSLMTFS